ncbi:MAG TPA: D-xylose ABC transporter ATP-binding protein, partial [Acidimicrobiales bacterium]|nr:D-xylose ABC transporter ATP-binding protein [Acidimicrobiales bacterium]
RIIDDLARSGMAIVLISSDLPEVLAVSDRVLVMREGMQTGLFDRAEATQERVMTAALGEA